MSFNTVGSPGSASYSGAGPINWAQLLNPQQPTQQGMGNNQNSLGAAIMQWLQQQQKQAQNNGMPLDVRTGTRVPGGTQWTDDPDAKALPNYTSSRGAIY